MLVPELLVSDIDASLAFWVGLIGFRVAYSRPEEGFAYLQREGAAVMLEDMNQARRTWKTGILERPFGRGINFQIEVSDIAVPLAALSAKPWPLYLEPEEKWYRAGDRETGQWQFLVQDPDGYLLRLCQPLGTRPLKQP
jgi:catechol 2,3-dioxygenase-like lactoylglutathione lyase family enzyme